LGQLAQPDHWDRWVPWEVLEYQEPSVELEAAVRPVCRDPWDPPERSDSREVSDSLVHPEPLEVLEQVELSAHQVVLDFPVLPDQLVYQVLKEAVDLKAP